MALEAELADVAAGQHPRIVRPVRFMAGCARLYANGGVFKSKRPALFGVALEARGFVAYTVTYV